MLDEEEIHYPCFVFFDFSSALSERANCCALIGSFLYGFEKQALVKFRELSSLASATYTHFLWPPHLNFISQIYIMVS